MAVWKNEYLNIARRIARITSRRYGYLDYDDIYQEACIGAWKAFLDFDESIKSKKAFVVFRVRQAVATHIEKSHRKKRNPFYMLTSKDRFINTIPFNHRLDEKVDAQKILSVASEILTDKQAEVFFMVHLDGIGLAETGREMGLPYTTVQPRYHDAKMKLQKHFNVMDG